MLGVVIYDRQGERVAVTPDLTKALTAIPSPVMRAITQDHEESSFVRLGRVPVHILALPIRRQAHRVVEKFRIKFRMKFRW